METVSKKLKVEDNCSEPFTQKGSHDDEVTLAFGKNKVYVSRNFLCLASPVFEAMFRNECREKKEKLVQMTGKTYEDFIEFLLCIHPRILKEVNELNVLRIVPLAEKYQVTSIITKCKAVMKWMLSNAEIATSLNYTDIIDLALKSTVRFGYCLYNGVDHSQKVSSPFCPGLDSKIGYNNETTFVDLYRDCNVLFQSFSLELRNKILSERLMRVNDKDFK